MTDDLLRIASEMEAGTGFVAEWAARIRACVSPEAVAFFEAAMAWCAIVETDIPTKGMATITTEEWAGYLIRLKGAYRAMLAAQEKGK